MLNGIVASNSMLLHSTTNVSPDRQIDRLGERPTLVLLYIARYFGVRSTRVEPPIMDTPTEDNLYIKDAGYSTH